jgi:hypothetical protein
MNGPGGMLGEGDPPGLGEPPGDGLPPGEPDGDGDGLGPGPTSALALGLGEDSMVPEDGLDLLAVTAKQYFPGDSPVSKWVVEKVVSWSW